MRGLTSATIARNPATELLKGKAEPKAIMTKKNQKSASNEDSDGPKWIFPDSNSVSAVRLWKLSSLWIVVLHLWFLPVVQAADTTAEGQSFSLLWISFLGALLLLYCLDRCLLWTNSYNTIHGFLSARIGLLYQFVSRRMNNNRLSTTVWILIVMVFKAMGLPVQFLIHSIFGYSSATYWIIVWHFICGVYLAARRSLIAFETDSALTILIKLAEQFLIVLANRRFGMRWMGVTVVFDQLDSALTILIERAGQFLVVLANRRFGMRWMGVTAVFDQLELFSRISNLGFLLEQILLVGPFHVWLRLGRFP